jgi:hypothetical protein
MTKLSHTELVEKIENLYNYERTKQIEPWAALWAENAKVVFPHDVVTGQRDVTGKAAIVEWTAKKFVERARTDIETRIEAMALEPRVLVTMNVMLHFANGLSIGGPLLVIFTFNEQGLISLMEEYVNDSHFPINYKEKAKPAAELAQ